MEAIRNCRPKHQTLARSMTCLRPRFRDRTFQAALSATKSETTTSAPDIPKRQFHRSIAKPAFYWPRGVSVWLPSSAFSVQRRSMLTNDRHLREPHSSLAPRHILPVSPRCDSGSPSLTSPQRLQLPKPLTLMMRRHNAHTWEQPSPQFSELFLDPQRRQRIRAPSRRLVPPRQLFVGW